MMKKISILLILSALIFLGYLLFARHSAESPDDECRRIKQEVFSLMAECRTCETDGECFLDESSNVWCPFGCYFIRSHAYDDGEYLSLIETKIKEYNKKCPGCKYDCPAKPEKHEIACRAGKCVDLRF